MVSLTLATVGLFFQAGGLEAVVQLHVGELKVVHEIPDRPLPDIAVLGLLAEGQDAARVAVAFDTSCLVIRHMASRAAIDFLNRYHTRVNDEAPFADIATLNHAALIYRVRHITRTDLLSVFALLTAREQIELLEAFAYYRAFCNSSVQPKELTKCRNIT